jgi:3-dehydroquinate synthase
MPVTPSSDTDFMLDETLDAMLDGIAAGNLAARLRGDKKTVHGKVHFVLPVEIGEVRIVSGLDETLVLDAIRAALA